MKKNFLIFATITTIVFTACSKEHIEVPQVNPPEEFATAAPRPGSGNIVPVNLNTGLLGRFEFNGNLKDTTGQVEPGITTGAKAIYTTDRKGMDNRAIKFNQSYGVFIDEVPLDTNMSISVWVKYDFTPTDMLVPFLEGSRCFALSQTENKYQAAYWNMVGGQYVISSPMNRQWHHLAATRNKNELRFYIDGMLVGTSPTPNGNVLVSNMQFSEYVVGYGYNGGYQYWKGTMDDLRMYNRILSLAEVQALYNL